MQVCCLRRKLWFIHMHTVLKGERQKHPAGRWNAWLVLPHPYPNPLRRTLNKYPKDYTYVIRRNTHCCVCTTGAPHTGPPPPPPGQVSNMLDCSSLEYVRKRNPNQYVPDVHVFGQRPTKLIPYVFPNATPSRHCQLFLRDKGALKSAHTAVLFLHTYLHRLTRHVRPTPIPRACSTVVSPHVVFKYNASIILRSTVHMYQNPVSILVWIRSYKTIVHITCVRVCRGELPRTRLRKKGPHVLLPTQQVVFFL